MTLGIFLFGVVVTLIVAAACGIIIEGIRIDKQGRERDEAELKAEAPTANQPGRV